MIEALLPKVRREILGLLFSNPDQEFYQRQIVRATEGGKGAVERELHALTTAGIILRERRGNMAYYRANRECPIYPELHGLMIKTAGVADVIRAELSRVPSLKLAFIFGSMARGTADVRSDVDVLVVGEAPFADISAALLAAQERLGREVSPTVYTPSEFEQRLRAKHHFLARVLREPKIMLVGTNDDLRRVGAPAPQ